MDDLTVDVGFASSNTTANYSHVENFALRTTLFQDYSPVFRIPEGGWVYSNGFFGENNPYTLRHVGNGTNATYFMRSLIDIVSAHLSFTYTCTDSARSEERRVGKECRSRWSTYK